MNGCVRGLALMVATTALAASTVAADGIPVAKDLTAVIALQGLPCGEVVSVTQKGENDYVANCKDGNQYRVSVDASGRVVVTKQ